MHHLIGDFVLRLPEISDVEALYKQKNDVEIQGMLEGFSIGRSRQDLEEWIEFHRQCTDEVLWVIADAKTDRCLGHVGLYKVDHRIGSAEFGIMIGERQVWGKGLGRACVEKTLEYGFKELNLNRIQLTVLANNERAVKLYRSLGFQDEGCLRAAQYKHGQHIDVLIMGMLRSEYEAAVALPAHEDIPLKLQTSSRHQN